MQPLQCLRLRRELPRVLLPPCRRPHGGGASSGGKGHRPGAASGPYRRLAAVPGPRWGRVPLACGQAAAERQGQPAALLGVLCLHGLHQRHRAPHPRLRAELAAGHRRAGQRVPVPPRGHHRHHPHLLVRLRLAHPPALPGGGGAVGPQQCVQGEPTLLVLGRLLRAPLPDDPPVGPLPAQRVALDRAAAARCGRRADTRAAHGPP
mmetsp:Transcript_23019/g.52723  ORF Transcript_23019/g.52723 Transcript_23019/m.52723 type:complete len:206 (-) Transcript_23019:316-933(-)